MAMQYMGSVQINGVVVPVTSCSLDKKVNPVIPNLVWGGGYKINYSKGAQSYEGEVSFPLFQSFVSTLRGIVNAGTTPGAGPRDTFFSTIVDNGVEQYTYTNCKVRNMTISSSSGNGELTVRLGLVAKGRTIANHAAGSGFTATTVANSQITPVPYFNTSFTAFGIASSAVTEWELSINNNPFILYTHDGTSDPNDIQLGLQEVTGRFTYYATTVSGFGFTTGQVVNLETSALADTDVSSGSASINTPATTLWTFGLGVIKDAARTVDNPNNKPMRAVTFELLGNTSNAPLY